MPRKKRAGSSDATADGLSSAAQEESAQERGEVSDETTAFPGSGDDPDARKAGASDDSPARIVASKEILDSIAMLAERKSSEEATDKTIDDLLHDVRAARQTLGARLDEAEQRASALESRNAELLASLAQSEQAHSATLEQRFELEKDVKALQSRFDEAAHSTSELGASNISLMDELAKANSSIEMAKEESAEELGEGRDTDARRDVAPDDSPAGIVPSKEILDSLAMPAAEKTPTGAREKTIDELLGEAQGDSVEDLDEFRDETRSSLGPRVDAVEQRDRASDDPPAGILPSEEVLDSIAMGTYDSTVHDTEGRIMGIEYTNDEAVAGVKSTRARRNLWPAVVAVIAGVVVGVWIGSLAPLTAERNQSIWARFYYTFVTPSNTDELEGTETASDSLETLSVPDASSASQRTKNSGSESTPDSENVSSPTVAMLTPPLASDAERQIETLRSQLDAAAQKTVDLETSRASVSEELAKVTVELEVSKESRRVLDERLGEAEQRASELGSRNAELRASLAQSEQAHAATLEQRSELERQVSALRSELDEAVQSTGELEASNISLMEEFAKVNSSIETAKSARQTLGAQLDEAEQRASELASRNEELVAGREQANSEMLAERAESEKRVEAVQSQLDAALQSTRELEAAKDSLGEELAKVTADLEASKESGRALDERLVEAGQRASELTSRNEELVASRDQLTPDVLERPAELEKRVETLQSQVGAAKQSAHERETENTSLTEELSQVTGELQAANNSRRTLNERLVQSEQRATELESRYEELVASREQADTGALEQRAELERKVEALQLQLDTAVQSTSDLQAVNNSFAEELEGFRTEFANVDDIKDELTVQRANNSQLKQQMGALGHDLEAAREKLVVMDKELQERITVVQTLQTEENTLKAELSSKQADRDALDQTRVALEEDVASLRIELNQSQDMVANLTATTNTQMSQMDALTVKLAELEAQTGEQQTELARASGQMRSLESERNRLQQLLGEAELASSEARRETTTQASDSGVVELSALEREETLNPAEQEAANWVLRGEELMSLGDIAAARLFFELAAEQGSAKAATAVGRTYDPVHYERNRVRGIPADPAKALEWYDEGLSAGDVRARRDIDALKVWIEGTAARGDEEMRRLLDR